MLVGCINIDNSSSVLILVILMLLPFNIGTPCNVKGGFQEIQTLSIQRDRLMSGSIIVSSPLIGYRANVQYTEC